jgi:hypothetical protein
MRNRELETIATMLVTTEDTYNDLESLDEEIVQRVWKYLVGCGIDPEDFRTKPATTKRYCAECNYDLDNYASDETICGACLDEKAQIKEFVVGSEVSCRSLGDWDCVFRFTVLKRTAKFVTLLYHGKERRVALRHWGDGAEYCYPLGMHSMAPMLKAGETL